MIDPGTVRVLHVDDDRSFAELAAEFLERERDDATVVVETSAEAGLDRLASGEFDAVVSDYEMSGRNGVEFLEAVRDRWPDLPFVLFTGEGSEGVASEAIAAGVTDYLRKSSSPEQYELLANRVVRAVASRERERELEVAERRFEAVFADPESFIGVLDPDGTLRRANETALAFVDADPGAVEGRPFPETPWWDYSEELQERLRSAVDRAADGEFVRLEAEHVGTDGEVIVVDATIRPVEDDDGAVVALIAEGRDITERKQRERALERQNERLEEFASIVSHDLRNPLNVATGRLELAAADCDSEHLAAARAAIERTERLVEDVLTLAREGQRPEDVEPMALADVAEAARRTACGDGVTLTLSDRPTVEADPSRLQRLLENLFGNAAAHAGPDVGVTVGRLEGGFYVADDGPGIPPEDRDEVLQSGVSTAEGGTGLGLAIVRSIAEAHDWSVAITEGREGGARFEFTGVTFHDG